MGTQPPLATRALEILQAIKIFKIKLEYWRFKCEFSPSDVFWYIFGEWQFKPCGRCGNFRSGKVLSSRQKVSVDTGPFIFISISRIFHVTLLPYSLFHFSRDPVNPVSTPHLVGRFRIAFTVNIYFYHVAMFFLISLDLPLEMQSLFAAWVMIYIIIHARSNSWMLAGFNMAWEERRLDALSWRFQWSLYFNRRRNERKLFGLSCRSILFLSIIKV